MEPHATATFKRTAWRFWKSSQSPECVVRFVLGNEVTKSVEQHVLLGAAKVNFQLLKCDVNRVRPHCALGDSAPEEFASAWQTTAGTTGSSV